MGKLILLAAIAFTLLAGTATVMTVHPHQAIACQAADC